MTPTTARRVEGHPIGEPSGVASQSRARINARTSLEPARRSTPEPETIVSRSLIVHPDEYFIGPRDRAPVWARASHRFDVIKPSPIMSPSATVSPAEPHTPNIPLGLTRAAWRAQLKDELILKLPS